MVSKKVIDSRSSFKELGRTSIGLNKSLVVSLRNGDGFYSIAQCIETETDQETVSMFMRNSIMIHKEGLVAIRDLLNNVIEQIDE